MTTTERNALIESYGNAYYQLVDALKEFPREMWQWKPAPDKWSIHEILIHITDSEANSYVRCRRFMAEPGSGVYGYNENLWAQNLNYHNQSIEDALELFKWLRRASYNLIKGVDEQTWLTAIIQHSENGTMTFDDWLRTYEEHIPVHIRQMQRNLQAWRATRI
ncbi:MAG TPA: DinB family protein [Chitinophagales bacterium]|nr:DinB family protein [Chitinophagales bacterium]